MKGRLLLVVAAMLLFGASVSLAQDEKKPDLRAELIRLTKESQDIRVGDEKEPQLRAELVRMAVGDQNVRGEFDKYRRQHGLFVDDKTLNEKLNKDSKLKRGFQAIAVRMQDSDDSRLFRMKQ